MKKLTAMLLSLMMCFSLMAIPARAAFIPLPDGPVIVDTGKGPVKPGDDGDDEPGISIQGIDENRLPGERENVPTD